MRTPLAWARRLRLTKSKQDKKCYTDEPPKDSSPPPPLPPKLDLSAVERTQNPQPLSPESPPPPDGCDEREVLRALKRLPGKPSRVRALLIALLAAGHNVSPSSVDRVASALVEDAHALRELVKVVAESDRPPPRAPVAVAGPPRERLRLAWAASNLIVAGPPALRSAVVKSIPLLSDLADVFTAVNYDPARAQLAADILSAALTDCPRSAAAAISVRPQIVNALVSHIDSAPAADVLARLVGSRVFGLQDTGAVAPAHKRSLAALSRHKVYHLLAQRFECAARKEWDVCAHIMSVASELSSRAMALPRMFEDPDERNDGYAFGMTHLNIVSAHVYNDAVDYLCLPCSPQPMLKIFDIGLESAVEEVSVPALQLMANTLKALVNARNSAVPTVSAGAKSKRTEEIETEAVIRMPKLMEVLIGEENDNEHKRIGRSGTAVIEIVTALLSFGSDETVCELVETHKALDKLLQVLGTHPTASVLHTCVSDACVSLMERASCARVTLRSSSLLSFVLEFGERPSFARTTETLVQIGDDADIRRELDDEAQVMLDRVCAIHAGRVSRRRASRSRGLFKELVQVGGLRRVDSQKLLRGKMVASEDKGKMLYARSAVAAKEGHHGIVEAAHLAVLEVAARRHTERHTKDG